MVEELFFVLAVVFVLLLVVVSLVFVSSLLFFSECGVLVGVLMLLLVLLFSRV